MPEFISEPLKPIPGTARTAAMATGAPGLPAGFTWRGQILTITAVLAEWKQSSPEGGRAGNEVYLRRHCYRLRMSDGAIWEVYFTRQTLRGGSPRRRWFLYACTPFELGSGPT